jgi:predicted solute-binding protein
MNFLDIEKAVLDGTVDAGVLIHESILTYDNELEVLSGLDEGEKIISSNVENVVDGDTIK